MSDCSCRIIDTFCPFCEKKTGTDKNTCFKHGPVYICGRPQKVCKDCRSRGLEYRSGTGGPTKVIDIINKKEYYLNELPQKPLILNFPDFSTRDQICNCDIMIDVECSNCSTFNSKKIIGEKKYCPTHDD